MSRRSYIAFDTSLCTACGACAVACMDEKDLNPSEPSEMYRKISIIENGHGTDAKITYLSSSCNHCKNAPCIGACPQDCIWADGGTGFVVYDNKNCIGCRRCFLACPFDAPVFIPDGQMNKCDGCSERVKNGLEPACVRVCPFDALSLASE